MNIPSTSTSYLARFRYYIPFLTWIPNYSLSLLSSDLPAGLSTTCILLPQALAYAQQLVRIPPVYGLYSCSIPLIIYSLLGTSRQLAIGPDALVSILTGSAIRTYTKINPDADPIAIATLLALMVGVFTLLLGLFRLGFLDSILSRALIRGFVSAGSISCIIK
jgi:MFS superfamily sulfate permease-like transporter